MSAIGDLRAALTGSADYDSLPESIKGSYTHQQWLWLSDEQKANLVRSETEPDWTE